MPSLKRKSQGFTLIELLMGILIVSIIGSVGIVTVHTMYKEDEVTVNNTMSVNLLRFSHEELKKISQNNFDNLGSPGCDYSVGNACGFKDAAQISADFPGFTRSVVFYNGNPELKQVTITLNWIENGQPKILNSTVLLSRPADDLPGNILGKVTHDNLTGPLIVGASVTVTNTSTSQTATVTSDNDPDADGYNYTFISNNLTVLGDWQLTATAPGYEPYTHPSLIKVLSGDLDDPKVSFAMDPKPESAFITVRLLEEVTNAPIRFSDPNSTVNVYSMGVSLGAQNSSSSINNDGSTYRFEIKFNGTYTGQPKECVTISTRGAWLSGFVGTLGAATIGYTCPTNYTAEGMSTSVIFSITKNCESSWSGTPDDICVEPGDNSTYDASYFIPVPMATITGNVIYNGNLPTQPLYGYRQWHDGNPHNLNLTTLIPTAVPQRYTLDIPAEQEFFLAPKFPQVWLQAYFHKMACCDNGADVPLNTQVFFAGPVYAGDTINHDFVFNALADDICGTLEADVTDLKTGAPLSNVNNCIANSCAVTNGSGYMLHQCSATSPYPIPLLNNYGLNFSRSGYYTFTTYPSTYYTGKDSLGNNIPSPGPGVTITAGQVAAIASSAGIGPGLWPKKYATITVIVREAGSTAPISGAIVTVAGPEVRTITTNGGGQAVFNNVLESWPPLAAIGNQAINQTVNNYTVSIQDSSVSNNYVTPVPPQSNIVVNSPDNVTVTFDLNSLGGM